MGMGVHTTETHHVSVGDFEDANLMYRTVLLHLPGREPVRMTPQDAQRLGQLLDKVGRGERTS